jgi:hypothetical protein
MQKTEIKTRKFANHSDFRLQTSDLIVKHLKTRYYEVY